MSDIPINAFSDCFYLWKRKICWFWHKYSIWINPFLCLCWVLYSWKWYIAAVFLNRFYFLGDNGTLEIFGFTGNISKNDTTQNFFWGNEQYFAQNWYHSMTFEGFTQTFDNVRIFEAVWQGSLNLQIEFSWVSLTSSVSKVPSLEQIISIQWLYVSFFVKNFQNSQYMKPWSGRQFIFI